MSSQLWSELVTPGVPVIEKILRFAIVYVFLVVGLRVAGKRELGQLNPFDLVVLLTLSNTVQNAIIGNDNSLVGGLIGAATLLLINALVVRWVYHHPRVDRLVEGEPLVVIEGGHVRADRLAQEYVTIAELESAARRHGFSTLEEVDQAVLEPGGSLTFTARKTHARSERHRDVVERLDALAREVRAIRDALPRQGIS